MSNAIDVIGDIHGEFPALLELGRQLGYAVDKDWGHPEGRLPVFLGDLIDRGGHSLEVAELVRHQLDEARGPADRYGAAYRRMLGDPLRRLQGLLGHASIRSTYVYLDSVDAAQELVDEAIGAWADDVADAIGAVAGKESP